MYLIKQRIRAHLFVNFALYKYLIIIILAECKTQNKKDEIVGSAYTRITIIMKITILILI